MSSTQLLFADPNLYNDTYFNRSVIFLAQYNDQGALGFILNQPSGHQLHELVPELELETPVFFGGPVAEDEIFYLHHNSLKLPGSIPIDTHWSWGNRLEGLEHFKKNPKVQETQYRLFLGYSGWESQQLEKEIESKSWVPEQFPSTAKLLQTSFKVLWSNKMRKLGGRYLMWSNLPDNPQHN